MKIIQRLSKLRQKLNKYVETKWTAFISLRNFTLDWGVDKLVNLKPHSDVETVIYSFVAVGFFVLAVAINFSS